jgi:hypothetical protein
MWNICLRSATVTVHYATHRLDRILDELDAELREDRRRAIARSDLRDRRQDRLRIVE